MLIYKRAPDSKTEEILKGITQFTDLSQAGSSLKKIGFISMPFGRGYIAAESYSGMELFLEIRPKFWILAIDERRYVTSSDLVLAKKFVGMKHRFTSRSEAENFISDIGDAKDIIEILEIDPNEIEKTKETIKEFNLDEIPF